ncbi:MAG: hypothetical protein KJ714_07560 [Euryarchaeota archaeon]|nr:hypothetical protein [Euryarchaeota archaeon]
MSIGFVVILALIVGAATVTGIAVGYEYKSNDKFQKWFDNGVSKTKAGIFGIPVSVGDLLRGNEPPVADFEIKGNLTEGSPIDIVDKSYDTDGKVVKNEVRVDGKVTPTTENLFLSSGRHEISLTAYDDGGKSAVKSAMLDVGEKVKQPSDYDYYDENFKVGIMIEGDPQFKQNVTNLIETFKQVTPDDYADLIKYAPKKIEKSSDIFSWYGGPSNNDFIELPENVEDMGGSEDLEIRKKALPVIYGEMKSAMESKTGVEFSSAYDAIMNDEKDFYDYGIKIGLWNKEFANRNLEVISEKLKTGTYFNGATSIVDDGQKYLPSD